MGEADHRYQLGEKKRQRSSSERMSLACCWDRRRAITLLRAVLNEGYVLGNDCKDKIIALLEDIDK